MLILPPTTLDNAKDNAQLIADTTHRVDNVSMQDLTALITLLINEIKSTLNAKLDILNEKIELKNEEISNLKQTVFAQQQTINLLKQEKAAYSTSLTRTPVAVNSTSITTQVSQNQIQRQRGIRSHNLIFTCPEIGTEEPKKAIEKILVSKFHRCPAIDSVKRFPEIRTDTQPTDQTHDAGTPTKMIVTFNSIWEVRSIYQERVQALRNSNIYISEDLYKDEAFLFYQARQLKKKKYITNCWTEEGQIYIVEQPGTSPKILNKMDPILKKLELINTEIIEQHEMQDACTSDTALRKSSASKTEHEHQQKQEEHKEEPETSSSESSIETAINIQENNKKGIKTRKTKQQK